MKPSAQIRAYNVERLFELLNDNDEELRLGYLVEIRKRRVESYHAYVPSSKRTLGNARGSLLVTD